tara:strand:+ start:257 stop:433 length:177 start_codon:yes stop_codon:yes gene_type:complete
MYQGTLTDKNSKRDNGQPLSIKFRDKSIFEVLTHFSMLIEDCKLKYIQIKIVKKDGKV